MKSFGCMPAVRTPEASRTLTVSCPGILPSPLRDKVGAFHHDRFRGYVSVHFRSGLHPPCLRFAVAVAGHHARLGTRLLVRLCRGRHHRRLNSMRLQGATRTESYVQLSCIRLPPRMLTAGRGLPYALRRRLHAFPALCPARAASVRVLLGLRPSLHRLRGRSPGLVRRLRCYHDGV
jgi:hypothetical protein